MRGRYVFDKGDFKFKKARTPVKVIVRRSLLLFLASISLAVVYYMIFATFFSTEEERKLQQENRVYAQVFEEIGSKEALLADVIEGLQVRDNSIYEEIFHASAPNVDPGSSIDYLAGLDSRSDADIVQNSKERLGVLEQKVAAIESSFRKAIQRVQDSTFVRPPMTPPLNNLSFAQTGASVGDKINPFYKVKMKHNGLDIIAHAGEPVLVVADGVVSELIKSRKGLGNVVAIDHGNGYVTRYAHLADVKVKKGRKVKKGDVLGCVGLSGNSFAPHLHYEVRRDTLILDPVHYFFATVKPGEYVNMLIMAATTGQSMD